MTEERPDAPGLIRQLAKVQELGQMLHESRMLLEAAERRMATAILNSDHVELLTGAPWRLADSLGLLARVLEEMGAERIQGVHLYTDRGFKLGRRRRGKA